MSEAPFNDSGWFHKDDDVRWQFGVPPKGNANFAWVQHFIRGSKEIHPRLLYRILTAKETLEEFQVQAESRSGTFPQITFDSIVTCPSSCLQSKSRKPSSERSARRTPKSKSTKSNPAPSPPCATRCCRSC